jgi:hypothetical protein
VLAVKRGYRQDGYSRGVLRILMALDTICRQRSQGVPLSLVLTSGTNAHTSGAHPPPRCEAVDVRSTTFASTSAKRMFLARVMDELEPHGWSRTTTTGYECFTTQFYGVLEYLGQPREHFHLQVRKGRTVR